MSLLQYDDGLTVDEDTGEMEGFEGGEDDRLAYIAREHLEARTHEKGWEQRKQALSRVLVRDQEGKRVTYGDVVCSIRHSSGRLDMDQYRDFVAGAELTYDDLHALAMASYGITIEKLPTDLQEILLPMCKPGTAYALTERVRQPAPRVTKAVAE